MTIEPDAPPHPADATIVAPATNTGTLGGPAIPVAAMASQSTAIEATRAVAEVQALVGAARMFPRIRDESIRRMREVCATPEVADNAFWSFRRSGQQLTGPTVQLMVQLALAWGNVTHGHSELRRDDAAGVSEMQAWAWDLEANVRVAQNFVVPHRRDKDGGRVPLTQDRDIYENNSNMAARRMREAIRKVLPPWFTAQGEELCRATAGGDPTVPLPMRVAKAVALFGDSWGVKPDQLEAWLEAPRNDWTVYDLGRLGALGGSIHRGETTVAREFSHERVTGDEIRGQATAVGTGSGAQDAAPANPEAGRSYAPNDPERPM